MSRRWLDRPEGSNWGDFGEDDQLGRLNLLDPAAVLRGVREVTAGRCFCLSLPLNLPGGNRLNPRRHPPILRPTELNGEPYVNFAAQKNQPGAIDVISDDAVLMWTQYSTQWDSLAHVGQIFDADGDGEAEIVYYNGYRGGEDVVGPRDYLNEGKPTGRDYTGADALGIQNMAEHGVQGRGVLVDLRHHLGDARTLVDHARLMDILQTDDITVARGDILCLHTGFADRIVEMKGDPDPEVLHNACSALDGRDERLLQWITDVGIVAIAADNYAVEALPSRPGTGDHHAMLPLHEHCLFKLGIPLGELWYFTELAAWLRENRRSRFLLTAPPLRLPGAVGSPLTPIATV
jgi:hypothetical protein